MRARFRRLLILTLAAFVAAPLAAGTATAAPPDKDRPGKGGPRAGFYENPLAPEIPGGGTVDSCADPIVLKGQEGERDDDGNQYWYMYCTTDPLNDEDRNAEGDLIFHPVPMMRSTDLVNWEYVGDALTERPTWAEEDAAFWAPDVVYSSAFDQYYMFFGVTDTTAEISGVENCDSDNAIGVAVSDGPTGPWEISETPVVFPRQNGDGCNFFWTYDPDVLGDNVGTSSVLYYGSYYGGIWADTVTFTETGASVAGGREPEQVAIPNRYEGANVVYRDGYYYMFVSATNCCASELTGYSVFVGRSESPFGPFVDREGNSFLDAQVGGTPVISMNGNRWIGTGHNTVFQDESGQWWTVYHAVDRTDPVFTTEDMGFTKRPALLDPIDWVNDWPTVRGGLWASDEKMPGPAAQEGQRTAYKPKLARVDVPKKTVFFEDFDDENLSPEWEWVREPGAQYEVQDGVLSWTVQEADLHTRSNSASVLLTDVPKGEYVVETRVRIEGLPDEGPGYNFTQAGLVIYEGDDDFIKLTSASLWETRQTEFAKESSQLPLRQGDEDPTRYGNTVVGPPGEDWTYLRIVKEDLHGKEVLNGESELYTAYTSQDGETWVRGGSWTHELGDDARIGLVAMGQVEAPEQTFTAEFDYVRVSRVTERRSTLV